MDWLDIRFFIASKILVYYNWIIMESSQPV